MRERHKAKASRRRGWPVETIDGTERLSWKIDDETGCRKGQGEMKSENLAERRTTLDSRGECFAFFSFLFRVSSSGRSRDFFFAVTAPAYTGRVCVSPSLNNLLSSTTKNGEKYFRQKYLGYSEARAMLIKANTRMRIFGSRQCCLPRGLFGGGSTCSPRAPMTARHRHEKSSLTFRSSLPVNSTL